MLFFSVGQQPTVVALSEAVRQVREEVGSNLPAGIVAYADDPPSAAAPERLSGEARVARQ
jgi:hypothetical protein